MLWRFCAYGFLKNQRYFEPILVLALLEAGASFFDVGLLIAIREGVRNLCEVPSGAAADLWGRRRTMVVAFVAYPLGLLPFVLAPTLLGWSLGMALFGLGDALRSGTHKAIIFDWLERGGRADQNTKMYGFTRSWSQIGSAVSIPITAAIVVLGDAYALTFWATAIPWLLNLVNLASYPRELEGPACSPDAPRLRARAAFVLLRDAFRRVLHRPALRALVLEAMAFEGIHKATKDYVQPAVLALVILIPAAISLGARADAALAIGAVYVCMHVAGAISARRAHSVALWAGSATRGSALVWIALLATLALTVATAPALPAAAIVGFASVAILHNVFRPLLVGRIDGETERGEKATVLSLESQASSLTAVVLAPLAGLCADAAAGRPGSADGLWAVAAVALLVAVVPAVRTFAAARR